MAYQLSSDTSVGRIHSFQRVPMDTSRDRTPSFHTKESNDAYASPNVFHPSLQCRNGSSQYRVPSNTLTTSTVADSGVVRDSSMPGIESFEEVSAKEPKPRRRPRRSDNQHKAFPAAKKSSQPESSNFCRSADGPSTAHRDGFEFDDSASQRSPTGLFHEFVCPKRPSMKTPTSGIPTHFETRRCHPDHSDRLRGVSGSPTRVIDTRKSLTGSSLLLSPSCIIPSLVSQFSCLRGNQYRQDALAAASARASPAAPLDPNSPSRATGSDRQVPPISESYISNVPHRPSRANLQSSPLPPLAVRQRPSPNPKTRTKHQTKHNQQASPSSRPSNNTTAASPPLRNSLPSILALANQAGSQQPQMSNHKNESSHNNSTARILTTFHCLSPPGSPNLDSKSRDGSPMKNSSGHHQTSQLSVSSASNHSPVRRRRSNKNPSTQSQRRDPLLMKKVPTNWGVKGDSSALQSNHTDWTTSTSSPVSRMKSQFPTKDRTIAPSVHSISTMSTMVSLWSFDDDNYICDDNPKVSSCFDKEGFPQSREVLFTENVEDTGHTPSIYDKNAPLIHLSTPPPDPDASGRALNCQEKLRSHPDTGECHDPGTFQSSFQRLESNVTIPNSVQTPLPGSHELPSSLEALLENEGPSLFLKAPSASAFCCRRRQSGLQRSRGARTPTTQTLSDELRQDFECASYPNRRRSISFSIETVHRKQATDFADCIPFPPPHSSEQLKTAIQLHKCPLQLPLSSTQENVSTSPSLSLDSSLDSSSAILDSPSDSSLSFSHSQLASILPPPALHPKAHDSKSYKIADDSKSCKISPISQQPHIESAPSSQSLGEPDHQTAGSDDDGVSLNQHFTATLEKLLRVSAVGVALGISIKMFFIGLQFWVTSGAAFILRLAVCQLLDNLIKLVDFSALHQWRAAIADPWSFYGDVVLHSNNHGSDDHHSTVEELSRRSVTAAASSIFPSFDDFGRMFPSWVRGALSTDALEINNPIVEQILSNANDVNSRNLTNARTTSNITSNDHSPASSGKHKDCQSAFQTPKGDVIHSPLAAHSRLNKVRGRRPHGASDISAVACDASYGTFSKAVIESQSSSPVGQATAPVRRPLAERLSSSIKDVSMASPVLRFKRFFLDDWVGREFSTERTTASNISDGCVRGCELLFNGGGHPIAESDEIQQESHDQDQDNFRYRHHEGDGRFLYVRKTTDEIFGWEDDNHEIASDAHHEYSNLNRDIWVQDININKVNGGSQDSHDDPSLTDSNNLYQFDNSDPAFLYQSDEEDRDVTTARRYGRISEPPPIHPDVFNPPKKASSSVSHTVQPPPTYSFPSSPPTVRPPFTSSESSSTISNFFSSSSKYPPQYYFSPASLPPFNTPPPTHVTIAYSSNLASPAGQWNEFLFHLKLAITALWNVVTCNHRLPN